MFYDALVDLKVPDEKAKAMYFAVYSFGPKWKRVRIGTYCGSGCSMNIISDPIKVKDTSTEGQIPTDISRDVRYSAESITFMKTKEDTYDTEVFDARFSTIQDVIKNDPDITLEELEIMARNLDPNNFPFIE